MNEGQEKFMDFILKRVQSGNETAAARLLSDTFNRQDTGNLQRDYMDDFIPQMLDLIKPECAPEVKAIMQSYDPNLTL